MVWEGWHRKVSPYPDQPANYNREMKMKNEITTLISLTLTNAKSDNTVNAVARNDRILGGIKMLGHMGRRRDIPVCPPLATRV